MAKKLFEAKRMSVVNGQVKQKLFFLIIILQNITLDQKLLKWIGIAIIFEEKMFYLKYSENDASEVILNKGVCFASTFPTYVFITIKILFE